MSRLFSAREIGAICKILAENAGIKVTEVRTSYNFGSDLQVLIRDQSNNTTFVTIPQEMMTLPPEELGDALIKQNPHVFSLTLKVYPRTEAIDELKRRTNILIDYANVILATAKAIQLEFEALK